MIRLKFYSKQLTSLGRIYEFLSADFHRKTYKFTQTHLETYILSV